MPVRLALILALVLPFMGGCAEVHRGVEAVGHVGSSAAPVEEAQMAPLSRPDVKTVRPHGAPRAPSSETGAVEPTGAPTMVAAAVPSPHEIFDFHPAGTGPASFRQPFIIDPNDGPLAADVRRSAKELREFVAGQRTDSKFAGHKPCSENDVATAKLGCVTPATKAATAATRSVTAVQ